MRVQIAPAYLGLEAGQSKRSKRRGVTKTIWQTRDGLRIPVVKMTDKHLVFTINSLLGLALKIKLKAKARAKLLKQMDHEISSDPDCRWLQEFDDHNWHIPDYWYRSYEEIAKMGKARLLKQFVPCFKLMVLEGYKRGLLHSSGDYFTDKGFAILNGGNV